MLYQSSYDSPIGRYIIITSKTTIQALLPEKIIWEKFKTKETIIHSDSKYFNIVKKWLDLYFMGKKPDINSVNININASTFRKKVLNLTTKVPYGNTKTYGEIAHEVKTCLNKDNMSPRAVGNALNNNPLHIIIPCHRIICSNGSPGGYSGLAENKIWLLNHERANL